MTMRKIKKCILWLLGIIQIPRNIVFSLLCGLPLDVTWRFYGIPVIRAKGRGSKIYIGRNFCAVSRSSHNTFGIIQKVMIRTIAHGATISIGDDVGVSGCTISAGESIKIGSRVLVGSGVIITDSDAHPIDPEERKLGGAGARKGVIIEDDVFIGARAIILKGVTVGQGSVIGAGAVVAKSIPPYSVVVGNPAKIVGDSRKKECRKSYETI